MASRTSVPGFAGYFLDGAGRLVINLSSHGAEAAASEFVRGAEDRFVGRPTVFRYVKYPFHALDDWRAAAMGSTGSDAFLFDVDEVGNRVVVGVADEASGAKVRGELEDAGLPQDAIGIRVVGEGPHDRSSLNNTGGVGGTRFFRDEPDDLLKRDCTLGVSGITGSGKRVFVSNAHCTDVKFGLDGEIAKQSFGGPIWNEVAVEIADPTYAQAGFLCRVLVGSVLQWHSCRSSDAAMFEWYPQVQDEPYYLARTLFSTFNGYGSRDIDPITPRFLIGDALTSNDDIYVGMEVDKVGIRTGWTTGEIMQCVYGVDGGGNTTACDETDPPPSVNSTCFNFRSADGNTRLYCQFEAFLYSDAGDSGSPVFAKEPPHPWFVPDEPEPRKLLGILWGGPVYGGQEPEGSGPDDGGPDENEHISWFSPWTGVIADLGVIDICHPMANPAC